MTFNLYPSKSGAGRFKSQLSIAAAPYEVNFRNGEKQFCGELKEIYQQISMADVVSVFDRHEKAFLDLETLWNHRRRKFIDVPTSQ